MQLFQKFLSLKMYSCCYYKKNIRIDSIIKGYKDNCEPQ